MGIYCSDLARGSGALRTNLTACGSECDILCSSYGLPVALSAQRVSELGQRVFVFLALAEKRRVGCGFGRIALGYALCSGPHGCSQRGDYRLAERAHHRKRGVKGFDGNKRIKGRKRFTLSDCGGNWLESVVVPANTGERAGALLLLAKAKSAPWSQNITRIWADQGFSGVDFEASVQARFGWTLDIKLPEEGQKGFCPVFKRWLIEQLFGCWGRYRRLSRDYEQSTACSRATLQVASLHRWIRRLKPAPNDDPPFRYK